MIKQDKGNCTLEGTPQLIINEAASVVLNVATSIFENTGVSEKNVLAQIQQAIQINILVKSGMSIDDAIEIADPKHNIVQVKAIEEDGSTTILKERNHEQ